MLTKLIGQQNSFFFSKDIELLFAAHNLLIGEPTHSLCTKVYGTDSITAWKAKYHFLFEVYSAFTFHNIQAHGLFEHLMYCSLEQFSLEYFRNYLLQLEPEDFLYIFFQYIPKDEITAARKSDEHMEALYEKYQERFSNYLGFSSLLLNPKKVINDLISFASELDTDNFRREIQTIEQKLPKEQERINDGVSKTEPLLFSEQLMGKTFHNRGPYEQFIFSPSLFIPYKSIRFFGPNQILFYTLRNAALKDEDLQKQLKAIADLTRYKIITILNTNGPMRGMDLAAELTLAPSTVSHHMDILYTAGLINEEPVKNTKYYSISRNNIDALLKRLTDTLGKAIDK